MLSKLSVHALAYPNSEILHFVNQDYTFSKNRDGTDLTLSYTGFSGWFYTGLGGGAQKGIYGKIVKMASSKWLPWQQFNWYGFNQQIFVVLDKFYERSPNL